MVEKEIIEKNLKEYLEIAEYSFHKRKFNTAVILYYKALVEICDLKLLDTTKRIGANHAERFELLKTTSPSLYKTASKLFRFYRDSYVRNRQRGHSLLQSGEERRRFLSMLKNHSPIVSNQSRHLLLAGGS